MHSRLVTQPGAGMASKDAGPTMKRGILLHAVLVEVGLFVRLFGSWASTHC